MAHRPPFDVALVSTHVAPAKGFGGIAECAARQAHAWSAAGRRFVLCASDASIGAPLAAGQVGLPPPVGVRLYRTWKWPRFGFGPGAVAAVFASCREAQAVYVNGVGTWPTTLAQLTCLALGRPMVVGLHAGLMPAHVEIIRRRKPLKWLYYRLLTLPALRRARALHLTSALELEGLDALVPGVPRHIVGNGLDLDAWRPLPPRTPDGGLTLCYVGRLSPEKGIGAFLGIWLRQRGPRDRLLIVGGAVDTGPDPYARSVMAAVAGAGGAVEMHPYLDAEGVRRQLARSDMLVLPSGLEGGDLRENFGNVVAESLACARPVLLPSNLAWDRAEADGFGLLFPPDAAGAAEALRRAAALGPADLARMAAAGRAYAERHLDIRVTAEALWRVLEDAVRRT
ncbi:MAG TPA: glycosyltransferase [Azospirillaceae bacterium]|nr:glycosyltransferase [Azospirillaceae bacterium]